MVMRGVAYLHKLNAPAKVVHHLLVAPGIPPFNRAIVLATGGDEPERKVSPRQFPQWRRAGFFPTRKVDVAVESRGLHAGPQVSIQKVDEAVYRVASRRLALIDERQRTVHHLHPRVIFAQRSRSE